MADDAITGAEVEDFSLLPTDLQGTLNPAIGFLVSTPPDVNLSGFNFRQPKWFSTTPDQVLTTDVNGDFAWEPRSSFSATQLFGGQVFVGGGGPFLNAAQPLAVPNGAIIVGFLGTQINSVTVGGAIVLDGSTGNATLQSTVISDGLSYSATASGRINIGGPLTSGRQIDLDGNNFTFDNNLGCNVILTNGAESVTFRNSGNLDVDGAAITLDGTDASNFTVAGNNLTLSTTGSGNVNVTSVGNVNLNATATQVQTGTFAVQNGTTVDEFSIDGLLAGNSDDALPTEQAVKTYVDAQLNAKDLQEAYVDGNVITTSAGNGDVVIAGTERLQVTATNGITATNTIQGGTLTDGTLSATGGAVTGATTINASGAITGGTLTDGTLSANSGAITGATTINASVAITGGTLTDGTLSSTGGAVTGATTINASGAITGGTLTDGTLSATGGAVTGATTIGTGSLTATGTVQGGTLTDGTLSSTAGAVTGATTINASGAITGGTLTDGTLSATGGAVTGATTINASGAITGGTLTDGTLSTTGGTITGATGITSSGAASFTGTFGLNAGTTVNELSIDGTLADNSDNALPTEQAVKTYVDGQISATDLDAAYQNGGTINTNGVDGDVIIAGTQQLQVTATNGITATNTIQGGTLTDGTLSATGGAVTGATTINASGAITGGTLTDGTLSATGGAVTGATTINASGAITGGTLTDGTLSATGGAVTGATTINASGAITGGTLTDGTLSSTGGAVTGATTINASGAITGGTLTDGTLSTTGGTITGATGITSSGAASFTGTLGLNAGTTVTELSIDGTLTDNSDNALPTEQAVKTYVDGQIGAQDLDAAYQIGGTITTTVGDGDVIIAGTEQLQVTATNGITATNTIQGGILTDGTLSSTAGAVTGATSIGTGSLTATGAVQGGSLTEGGSLTDGTLTATGGAISAATSIGTGSLTATGAVQGGSLTDGTLTATGGAISAATSIGTGSLTATGAVQGGSLTDGTLTATGGAITGATGITSSGAASFTGTLGLNAGTTVTELSIDGTLADDSDNALPTEQAVKTYVDGQIGAQDLDAAYQIGGTITTTVGDGDVIIAGTEQLQVTATNGINATNTIQGGTLTDGTLSSTAGAVTGATSIGTGSLTATGAVQGGSLTDGTITITGGAITGLTTDPGCGTWRYRRINANIQWCSLWKCRRSYTGNNSRNLRTSAFRISWSPGLWDNWI